MTSQASSPRPGDFLPGWTRRVAFGAFAVFPVLGLQPMNPSPAAAAAGAVVALGGGAMLAWQRRPQLGYALAATGGIAVLGHGTSANVGWFGVCLLAAWCGLTAGRRACLAYWAATMVLFAVEWLWIKPDPGWGAWIAGVSLTVSAGLLVRHEADLVAQLRMARRAWPSADRAAAVIFAFYHDLVTRTAPG